MSLFTTTTTPVPHPLPTHTSLPQHCVTHTPHFPSTVSHTHAHTSLPQHSASPNHPPITLPPSTTLTQSFSPPLISVLQERNSTTFAGDVMCILLLKLPTRNCYHVFHIQYSNYHSSPLCESCTRMGSPILAEVAVTNSHTVHAAFPSTAANAHTYAPHNLLLPHLALTTGPPPFTTVPLFHSFPNPITSNI